MIKSGKKKVPKEIKVEYFKKIAIPLLIYGCESRTKLYMKAVKKNGTKENGCQTLIRTGKEEALRKIFEEGTEKEKIWELMVQRGKASSGIQRRKGKI